jgi:ATP-dependent DNA helicase RecG
MARDEAQKIIDEDPACQSPKYQMLWNRLRELRKSADGNSIWQNWSAIS